MRLSVLAINQLLASPTLRFDTLCSSILQVHYNMLMHTVHLLEHHHKSHLILTGQNSGGLQELGQKAIFLSFSLFCLEPNPLTKNVIPIQKKRRRGHISYFVRVHTLYYFRCPSKASKAALVAFSYKIQFCRRIYEHLNLRPLLTLKNGINVIPQKVYHNNPKSSLCSKNTFQKRRNS